MCACEGSEGNEPYVWHYEGWMPAGMIITSFSMPHTYNLGMSVVFGFVASDPPDIVFCSDGREAKPDGTIVREDFIKTLRVSDHCVMGMTGNVKALNQMILHLYAHHNWPAPENEPDEPLTNYVEMMGWTLPVIDHKPFMQSISEWLSSYYNGAKSELLIAVGVSNNDVGKAIYTFSLYPPYSYALAEEEFFVLSPPKDTFKASAEASSAEQLIMKYFGNGKALWAGRIDEFCRETLHGISPHYCSINNNLMMRTVSSKTPFELIRDY